MQYWIIQTLNSLALGGLLFLLAAGFSLIFGLMRIANLTHGSLYMLGAYVGISVLKYVPNLWLAAIIGGVIIAVFGGLVERLILRPLAGNALGQVLVTLGISFIIADLCLMVWGGDPLNVETPDGLGGFVRVLSADTGQPSCGDTHDAFSKPLEAEGEQEGADDQTQRPDGHAAERGAQHEHDHRQHPEAGSGADQCRTPTPGRPDADHDRDHLDRFHGRGEEGRDEDSPKARHESTLPL